jgi:hypothetical protein
MSGVSRIGLELLEGEDGSRADIVDGPRRRGLRPARIVIVDLPHENFTPHASLLRLRNAAYNSTTTPNNRSTNTPLMKRSASSPKGRTGLLVSRNTPVMTFSLRLTSS